MFNMICVKIRDEDAKRMRRILGDNGGVKHTHGTYTFRAGFCNALDSVPKDNLLAEVYEL